ncbi:MAG: hypothetical protein ACREFY_18530, partial [Acetobacteraceae bacterium]
MGYWGKIIGGMAGFAMGGPMGAVVGAALGHAADTGAMPHLRLPFPATDPLFASARMAARLGRRDQVFALGVVTLAGMVATGYWWSSITKALRVSTLTTVLGLLLVLLSPLALSAIGLETVVLVALLIGMLAEAIRGRAWMFGVLAGLAVLTRLDAVVFVLVLGLAMGAIRRRWYQALGPMLLIAMPWFVTSWFVL